MSVVLAKGSTYKAFLSIMLRGLDEIGTYIRLKSRSAVEQFHTKERENNDSQIRFDKNNSLIRR